MKRFRMLITLLLAFAAAFALSPAASADVPWVENKPQPDAFYSLHQDECEPDGHSYVVQEKCRAQKSPKNRIVTKRFEPGDSVYIVDKWNDWGLAAVVVGPRHEIESYIGWIQMDALRRLFSFDDVDKSVYGEVVSSRGDPLEVEDNSDLYFYTFPGSGRVQSWQIGHEPVYYDEVWTDPLGRDWGYVSYYFTSSGWLCLDDPYSKLPRIWPEYADETPDFSSPSPASTPVPAPAPTPSADPEPAPPASSLPLLLIALVAGLTIVTALMIVLIIHSKKKRSEG